MSKEGPTSSTVNCGTDGLGIDCANVDSTIIRVEVTKERIRNNERILRILSMLTMRIVFNKRLFVEISGLGLIKVS